MHSTIRLGDAVTDLRINAKTKWARIVVIVQKERDLVGVQIFQILSRRLKVYLPRTASVGWGCERDDLGGHGARRFKREVGAIGRAPDMMRDVPRNRVR